MNGEPTTDRHRLGLADNCLIGIHYPPNPVNPADLLAGAIG
jgi:hypothetical protein